MNGLQLGEESASPAARSPATGRALISAARSQFWPGAFVIGERRQHRERERRRGGIGPQPQIGAEDIAVAGALRRGCAPDRCASRTKNCCRAASPGIAQLRRVEEHDEVDIAGIVELARAELAHAEHDEAAVALRLVRMGEFDFPGGGGCCEKMPHRAAERRLGDGAQGARDTFQRPQPGDVGDGDQQRRPPLSDAQVAHQAGLVLALGEMPIERLVEFGENGVRPPLDEPNQEIGLLEAALRKKGTVAEEGGKKPLPGRLVGERPHLGGKRRVGGFRRFAPVHQAEALRRVIGGCRQMVVSGGRR